MKIKTQLTLASLIAVGMFATGCSQQQASGGTQTTASQQTTGSQQTTSSQQTTGSQQTAGCPKCPAAPTVVNTPKPPVKPMPRPRPRSSGNKWTHSHPANKCTKSVTHTHKHAGGTHRHSYSCGPKRPTVYRPPVKKQPMTNAHTHPAIPNCTDSISHTHPNGRSAHKHAYSCKPMMAPIKAKGNYKGSVGIDRGAMQGYGK